mmetsp:Transcript_12034/g.28724  ORF Transcript_12034/g.28724 Transcript_12034/m.28724 type:complete len:228 (-) Transcript_12034:299-982(-)
MGCSQLPVLRRFKQILLVQNTPHGVDRCEAHASPQKEEDLGTHPALPHGRRRRPASHLAIFVRFAGGGESVYYFLDCLCGWQLPHGRERCPDPEALGFRRCATASPPAGCRRARAQCPRRSLQTWLWAWGVEAGAGEKVRTAGVAVWRSEGPVQRVLFPTARRVSDGSTHSAPQWPSAILPPQGAQIGEGSKQVQVPVCLAGWLVVGGHRVLDEPRAEIRLRTDGDL